MLSHGLVIRFRYQKTLHKLSVDIEEQIFYSIQRKLILEKISIEIHKLLIFQKHIMNLPRLGVNIDHVATIRNARGENYPSPLKAALLAQKFGADSITIHLREDRRHIKDQDLKQIKKNLKIPLNLEMAPTSEMLRISLNNTFE